MCIFRINTNINIDYIFIFYFYFLKQFYLFIFRQRGKEGERKGRKPARTRLYFQIYQM